MSIQPDSISAIKAQLLTSTTSLSGKNNGIWDNLFSALVSPSDPLSPQVNLLSQVSHIKGLSATGRNMALADPESAYKMMSIINNVEVVSKVQYSELTQMKSSVSQLQQACQPLIEGQDNVKLKVLGFVGEYNNWIRRYSADLKQGGILAGTQAAEVSQYELEQSMKSRFFGAGDGISGMEGLGILIDPVTHLAAMDSAQFDSQLSSNRQGVMNTVHEFGANFAKSASLLVSEGNFFSKQLDNLDRGIRYISDNKAALQQEFGMGDAARPNAHAEHS